MVRAIKTQPNNLQPALSVIRKDYVKGSNAHLSSLCRRLRPVKATQRDHVSGQCAQTSLGSRGRGRNTQGQNQVCSHHHFCPVVKGCLAQSGARSLLAEPSLGTHCCFGSSPMWSFTKEAARESQLPTALLAWSPCGMIISWTLLLSPLALLPDLP